MAEVKAPEMPKAPSFGMPKFAPDTSLIKKEAEEFMKNFGLNYAKAFGVGLILSVKEEKEGGDEEEKRHLVKFEPHPPELKGMVKYSPTGTGKTVPRWFQINEDWHVEIFKTEEDAKKDGAKPLKVFNPMNHWSSWWRPPTKEFPLRRGGPKWESVGDITACPDCKAKFGMMKRKYWCRTCGGVRCATCTENKYSLTEIGYAVPQRVCAPCLVKLTETGLNSFEFPDDAPGKEAKEYGVECTFWYGDGLHFLVDDYDKQWEWIYALRECRYHAKSFENDVASLNYAFKAAFKEVWWHQGPWWRSSDSFASEADMLGYLLAYILNRNVTPKLLEPLTFKGAKARAAVEKAVQTGASSAVKAGWPPLVDKMKDAEKGLREKVAELTGPFF